MTANCLGCFWRQNHEINFHTKLADCLSLMHVTCRRETKDRFPFTSETNETRPLHEPQRHLVEGTKGTVGCPWRTQHKNRWRHGGVVFSGGLPLSLGKNSFWCGSLGGASPFVLLHMQLEGNPCFHDTRHLGAWATSGTNALKKLEQQTLFSRCALSHGSRSPVPITIPTQSGCDTERESATCCEPQEAETPSPRAVCI